ncbi:MAG: hypothetical protein LQ349_003335 [Xanthoria aureola]|nr:MAG: hypothetical protein LQ349_003335 [Xanthoria aureola]
MACSLIPSEIRLRIFESCPNVPTAASLAKVSKPFNNTWMSYKKSVCLHILERTIEYYQDARILATENRIASRMISELLQQFIEHYTPKILANAKAAEYMYELIIHDSSLFQPIRKYDYSSIHLVRQVDGRVILSPVERQRFVSAWYKINTITVMLQRQSDGGYLAYLSKSTSNQDVFLMLEVTRIICEKTTSKDTRQKLGMDEMVVQQLHLPSEVLQFTPNPQEYPWEAAMVYLRRNASARVKEAGLLYLPGETWNLRVLLDDYQHVLGK